jgi:hypothetical protein
VPEDFDTPGTTPRQAHVPLADRLRELLAANDLPDLTLVLDGEVVEPMFSRRGGSKVAVEGSWGRGTTATVKAYRRPPGDRQGAYYVRLGGLFQFKVASQRGNLKADVVVDLRHHRPPRHDRLPAQRRPRRAPGPRALGVPRPRRRGGARERERRPQPGGRGLRPGLRRRRRAARRVELADLAAEAFADVAFQKALAEAAGGIADFYAERAKDPGVEAPTASLAPAGTRVREGDGPTRGAVLPPGLALHRRPVEADIASPSRGAARVLLAADAGPRTAYGIAPASSSRTRSATRSTARTPARSTAGA